MENKQGHRVPWRKDAEILERLEAVARYDIQGKTTREIGALVGVSHETVAQDLRRITELRTEKITDAEKEHRRQRSIAVQREVQRKAWEQLEGLDKRSMNASGFLNTIIAAEKEIARLQGTAPPTQVRHGGDPDNPTPIATEQTNVHIFIPSNGREAKDGECDSGIETAPGA